MRIDRRLHLVIPLYSDVEGEEGRIFAQVHSAPLSEELVDRWWQILGSTYRFLFSGGLGMLSGPGHAARALRQISEQEGVWFNGPDGQPGVELGLMAEIRRLTNVAIAGKDGRWQQIPFAVAAERGEISPKDKTEVENAIVFFIAASATLNRLQLPGVLRAYAELWSARITSSPPSEWASSLKTWTETDSGGEKSTATARKPPAPATAHGEDRTSSLPY